ncbi:acetylornithine deacetylase [Candidatus Tachikawaea gelatinosa]|uniref:Acetylornithine deacetylase n=1 Tax=Candidatus Tachikawaea gelatinosa TaxID=1410383 RepID=A0A090BWG4_9ENTR|nr:acetylornithine deacetylase [Candidatus Tachikawaea gelatinosa]BAP58561.1 acetylornithine deacetylase [Candidatus Tachikawaea gelatinosa]
MKKLPKFIEMLRQLIAIPSISSTDKKFDISNKKMIDLLSEWFESVGFSIEIQVVSEEHKKFNMIAYKGNKKGGLLLSGHTDTVSFNEKFWKFNPFKLTEKNHNLYGLGVVDMKIFFVIILSILSKINLKKIKHPLYILATSDEETTMFGIKHFVKNKKFFPKYAIIGEPTSLNIIRGHKGYFSAIIQVFGKSAHSSNPAKGINAIEIMQKIIDLLKILRENLTNKYKNINFNVPYPTINIGKIHGGDSTNKVCDFCELHIDIRPTPNISIDNIYYELNSMFSINKKILKYTKIKELYPCIPSYECKKDNFLVKKVESLIQKPSSFVNYCTEASFLQKCCPVIVLGPGSIEQAHKADEFISINDTCKGINFFKKIIKYFCL